MMIWYHGTTEENYKKIQKEHCLFGFRGKNISRCTYLASSLDEAKCYGSVILKIDYDPSINPNENNYVDNCWQIRVYEPIYTFERI